MAQPAQLAPFSESAYEQKTPLGHPVSCPTLDLSAVWDVEDRNLLIYRPPNQIVSKIHQVGAPGEKAPEVLAVTWKPDGQFLAVGWSDGFVRLMGLENNKAAHHLRVCEGSATHITHIGWALCQIDDGRVKRVPGALQDGLTDAGLLGGQESPMDLPRELTFLEIETALPKISPLPSASAGGGEDAMVFTLRSGVEFLFQPLKPEDYDQVNAMIIGTSDGKLQLSIYDSFIVGSFDSPVSQAQTPPHLVRHAAHPRVSTHALLLAEKPTEPDAVHLVPMDLPFISSSPINLSLLASKLTTLQKLLRYLKQTQLHMQVEWRNTRELPGRFLRPIEGDLIQMEMGPRSIISALYHMALTGHAPEPVREWLVDTVAERGHKRWDKAVMSGLENLRNLVHENYLPALDRCAVILSRLKGLAQFHDHRSDIGFTTTQMTRIADIISSLTLVGHKILIDTMDELEHFTAFSTWLRFQIDELASSSPSDELTEKLATMDNNKVLTYIERYLNESPLGTYLGDMNKEEYSSDWSHIEDGPRLLDILDQQLTKAEAGQSSMQALPHVEFLVDYVTTWCTKIFEGIAEAMKRSVRFGKPIKLSLGQQPVTHMGVRMCKTEKETRIVTALASKESQDKVHIFCTGINITNGISNNLTTLTSTISLAPRSLTALNFLDDSSLILLCAEPNGTPKLLRVPVKPDKLPYAPYDPQNPAAAPTISADEFVVYTLPDELASRPVAMEVHERSDVRGEIPARVCLLESGRTMMRSFMIPALEKA